MEEGENVRVLVKEKDGWTKVRKTDGREGEIGREAKRQ